MNSRRETVDARPPRLLAQSFAQAVLRLNASLGGGDASARHGATLAAWAQRAWQSAADGHACVEVRDARERELLAACPAVVPDGLRAAPLVLDGSALYLHRLWQAESTLAERLLALDAPAPIADGAQIDAVLAELAAPAAVDERQRDAIRAALTRRLAIVTGGPGTGKTTTLARLLVAVSRLAPDTRVAIAAPTGKAAGRLAHALGEQLAKLDPGGLLASRLPSAGLTVHRLLGLRGDGGRRLAGTPRHDLVIVDEASMLDLEMARALAEAIPDDGRLVLAGDRDQLASVEAGAVFAEACASPLAGVVRLERNYRQASAPALSALASWLRDRASAASAPPPPFDAGAGVECLIPGGAETIAAQAVARWEPALARIAAAPPPGFAEPAASAEPAGFAEPATSAAADDHALSILASFESHRVLCAMREGPLGTVALNAAIAARIRSRLGAPSLAIWYPGRIVIVTRNRPELGLFNGDVGVCLPTTDGNADADPGALAVVFDTGAGARRLPVRQMPAHEDAFAMTVHKSQGSEFESVALVPAPRGHPLNTRELLYTGATRARARLVLWADPSTIDDGAMRRTERHGRLADRIGAGRGVPA